MSISTEVSVDTEWRIDLISEEQRQTFALVNHVFLCGIIGLFGIASNIVNLVVFYKQGLDTTINISFFAMAVSDLWSLVFQMWYTVGDIPFIERLSIPELSADVYYLLGGCTREIFARITCFITVYVTAERCLCITYPLHVKQIITPRRTTIIVTLIYLFSLSYMFPLYVIYFVDKQFYTDSNQTLFILVADANRDDVEAVVSIIHAFMGVVSMVAVVVFTSILIIKLGQTSAWRRTAKINDEKSDPVSKRDRATVRMVVLIASILIMCYLPAVAFCLARFCDPEYALGGKFFNSYFTCWTFALVLETINSSANVFFYYKLSSRFRQVFREIFFPFRPVVNHNELGTVIK